MTFCVLQKSSAQRAYDLLEASVEPQWEELEAKRGSGPLLDVQPFVEVIDQIRDETDLPLTDGRAAVFEGQVGVALHEHVSDSTAVQDADFWRWLAFRPLREVILDRHQTSSVGMPDKANFGLGAWVDNFAYRSWLRAEIGHNPAASPTERYSLALRGDQDFWRSFLFRTRYGFHRNLVHALIEFQYPEAGSSGVLVKGEKDDGIRMLAKRLARCQANTAYAFMSKEQARCLIERLADGLTQNRN